MKEDSREDFKLLFRAYLRTRSSREIRRLTEYLNRHVHMQYVGPQGNSEDSDLEKIWLAACKNSTPEEWRVLVREELIRKLELVEESSAPTAARDSGKSGKTEPIARTNPLFSAAELFSFILPRGIRIEAFEPAYNDLKSDLLKVLRRHKSAGSYRWLMFCFSVHVIVMTGNCFWLMCSDKVKRAVLRMLPDVIRRIIVCFVGCWGFCLFLVLE